MLKKYIAREPEVDMVPTSNKDDATVADTDPKVGKVPDLEGYHPNEGVKDVNKLGKDLPEDQGLC